MSRFIIFFRSLVQISKGSIIIGGFEINEIVWGIVSITFIIILMYVVARAGTFIINHAMGKQSSSKLRFTLDERKAKTLAAVLSSILRYAVYFLGIGAILTKIFGSISLTFAGIGGVAIGFGAQSLVKDVINGFFILFEDQFSVGDYIHIDNKGGIVESIELRVTKLRDFNGDLHIIPNGLITQVTNHSKGNMRVMVDIDIAYEVDIDYAMEVIQAACDEFKHINEDMVEGPRVVGVTALKDSGVTIRVFGKAKSMTQWECENRLRKHLKTALDKDNIEIAYPIRKIISK